ncbi:GTP-binding protein [Streptomyces benahoarensis]|uniref:GTP-binding protein n=1 Tax=Streptomyces benahoarensis TaxID=2595054 RepID=UPI002035E231|nr:GTP-binding protein [Streptomyces benahoarensis]
MVWRARRPLHPESLADTLPTAMAGVVRGRGHLWLASRPAAVVTWRSAGPHMELHEAGCWLEPGDDSAWRGASPQRRTRPRGSGTITAANAVTPSRSPAPTHRPGPAVLRTRRGPAGRQGVVTGLGRLGGLPRSPAR